MEGQRQSLFILPIHSVPTLLAIETSSVYCSAALLREGQMHARSLNAGQTHSGRILQLVSEVLAEAQCTLADCAALAFGAGPGSFTGLRIACAVTQGLAYGASLPVIPVSTLTAMAEQVRLQHIPSMPEGSTVLCALDARMGEIYWSVLIWRNQEWVEQVPPSLDVPEALPALLAAASTRPEQCCDFGCGNAMRAYADQLSGLVKTVAEVDVPDARWIAAVAARALQRGAVLAAQEAAPLYIRDRVALTTEERARVDQDKDKPSLSDASALTV